MIVFFTDLDNTLIYSYKHNIGADKECVEIYNGREISYATKTSLRLIQELSKLITIVPTSTRTMEQFNRINLGLNFKYSLVCNGGILLINGVKNEKWYQDSLKIAEKSIPDVKKAIGYLENNSHRYFELRYIENLFLFTKCHEPEIVIAELKQLLDCSIVNVFNNGEKVYVVPNAISKGNAIKRFLDIVNIDKTISAGDSEFDISMVTTTDIGIIPKEFPVQIDNPSIYKAHEDKIFSEEVLSFIKNNICNK